VQGLSPPKETISHEDVDLVDKKLEEVAHDEPAVEATPPATNGTPVSAKEDVAEFEEAPAEVPAAEEAVEPEKPKDPAPTPAPVPKASPKPASSPAAPPKPAMPKTWAQLASQNRSAAAAAAAAPAQTSTASPSSSQPKVAPQAAPSSTPAASTPAPPVRESSPADSGKEGSSGGWQTAGAEHSRKASRAQAQPAASQDGKVRAYVKNVYQSVDADALKAQLSKYGELAYFDVSRPKV